VNTNIVDDTVINLGDSLVLKYVKHDVDMEIRMVGYTYDGYANRYITIQLGDAKQSYVGNVQNTVRDIETNVNTNVKQTVNQILNANGERLIYSDIEPVGNFRNGDVWYDEQGGMYFWDEESGMWIDHPYNRNMNLIADKIANEIEPGLVELDKSIADADTRANTAIEKAGANANLLTTHQNTLDTINTTTLPDIASTAGTALANAKSAMDEAKKADGKIADYVTKNGLVNGTTVDTKINDATGEINKKITTVESKIPTQIGGRNLLPGTSDEWKTLVMDNGVYFTNFPYDFKPVAGETYTFSIIVEKVNQSDTVPINLHLGLSTVKGGYTYDLVEWRQNNIPMGKKVSLTYTLSEQEVSTRPWFAFRLRNEQRATTIRYKELKLEKGAIATDWTPAPEDNLSQSEFQIFESTYDEHVKGINSTLTELSNKKVDGSTYQNFYDNEYKKTAQGVTDTYAKVNKIIDENGNATDTFAKAVYDRNAERQKLSFNAVTKDLVTTATYEAGVKGINQSISEVEGKIPTYVGGRNLLRNSNFDNGVDSWAGIDGGIKEDGDLKYITVVGTFDVYQTIHTDKGQAYTVSALVRKATDTNSKFLVKFNGDNADTPEVEVSNSEWKRISTTRIATTTGRQPMFFHTRNDFPIDIAELMIEKGNVATDWSPAPEDMATVVKTNEIERTANGNKTTISDIKTKPGEQITGYQTIKDRSDLYERVIGSSSEAGVKNNMARIVMADSIFKTEVIDKTNVDDSNTFSSSTKIASLSNMGALARDESVAPNGFKATGANRGNGSFRLYNVITSNGWWTVSGWVRGTQNADIKFSIDIADSPSSQQFNTGTANEWQYFEFSHNVTNYSSTYSFVDFNGLWWAYYYFKDIKVEKNHHATAWTPSAIDFATQSHITQLADNINLKVSKSDLLSQINVQAGGVLITSGTNKLNITPETTYIQDATIKSAMIASLVADKIKTGTLDASKVSVVNLDANNITANKTSFVQSAWNDINSEVAIDGSGIKTQNTNGDFSRIVSGELRSFNKDSSSTAILGSGRSQYFDKAGSQFILGNTLHGTEWINDGTLQVTHNRRFAIGRYADYAVNNGLFHPYIALEYPPDKTGDEPMGIVRFYKAVYLQKDIYAGYNNISGLGKISFYNGGHIESQANTSNLLIGASNKIVAYASGTNAFEVDSGYMYLRRNLSMEGNNITNQSDRRLKTNIVDTPVDSLSAISGWDFKAFDRVNNGSHDDIGLIAQDTSEIVIYDEENDIYNVNSSKQIMMNSHGIQLLNTKVDDEITQLKAQIASLQDELVQIKGA